MHPVAVNTLLPASVSTPAVMASRTVEQGNIAYNKRDTRRARRLYAKALRLFEHAPIDNYDVERTVFSLANIEFRFGDAESARRALERFLAVSRPNLDDAEVDNSVRSHNYRRAFQRLLELSESKLQQSADAGGPTADADKWEIIGLKRASSGQMASALEAFQNSFACAPALGRAAWLGNIGIAYLAIGKREAGTAFLLSAPMTDMFLSAAATRWAGIALAAWSPRQH
jgi:tetratricopeptide (TPR) repeat protein